MPDFDANFMVDYDSSDVGVGAVLMQYYWPAACISKVLNSMQCNYNTTNLKLLAIVLTCKIWHPYLDSKKTILLTDHKPLIGVHTTPDFDER